MGRDVSNNGAAKASSLCGTNPSRPVLERNDVRGDDRAAPSESLECGEIDHGRRLRQKRIVISDDELECVLEPRE